MAGVGLATFTPRTAAVRTVTSAPQGGWTQIQDPKAFHYNGATYAVWTNGSSGDIEIAKYDEAAHTTTTHVLAAAFEPGGLDDGVDIHSSPSVIVRPDGHIVVAAAHHAETDGPYVYISTNAEDITAWGSAVRPDASIGAAQYTYMILYQLASGAIYLFYRDYISGTSTGRLAYSASTDGGSTWSARTVLYTGASGHVPYWRVVSDWDDRFDIFITDIEPNASKLGHFYLIGSTGKRYTSAGVEITTSLPIGYSDVTQVHAATAWSWGGCIDSMGRPATVLMVDITGDNAIKVARWRSGAWQVNTVVSAVGGHLGINQYASGCGIHHTNPNIVYVAKKATHWEMWRYVSADDGATWTGTQLTSGSSSENVWADVVHHADRLEGIWAYGTYSDDLTYSFGIRGWG